MKILTVISAIVAALVVAALGCYVLLELKSTWGVALVLLSLCIAFPTTVRTGVSEFTHSAHDLKDAGVLIVPVVVDAQPGGDRKFDPPAPRAAPAPHVDHGEGDETGEGR